MFPILVTLTLKDSYKVATALRNIQEPDYNKIIATAKLMLTNITPPMKGPTRAEANPEAL